VIRTYEISGVFKCTEEMRNAHKILPEKSKKEITSLVGINWMIILEHILQKECTSALTIVE
jgi:hypothetical protein